MSERSSEKIELVFSKSSSNTKTSKINEFWKFIDSQDKIQPYTVKNNADNSKPFKNKNGKLGCESKKESYFGKSTKSVCSFDNKFWCNELLVFKALGLDKIALSTCKYKRSSKEHNEKLILSDMVKQTYEEINDELKNFEQRLGNK